MLRNHLDSFSLLQTPQVKYIQLFESLDPVHKHQKFCSLYRAQNRADFVKIPLYGPRYCKQLLLRVYKFLQLLQKPHSQLFDFCLLGLKKSNLLFTQIQVVYDLLPYLIRSFLDILHFPLFHFTLHFSLFHQFSPPHLFKISILIDTWENKVSHMTWCDLFNYFL